ncbi:thioredoxin-like protein [Dysgonomonas alginatilytica]|uniref:Thioredoxin-like protein n=1 Tax=Dysgonomonas alginatilytica TaxID=1605892 RepID=A0A2V3PQU3_9BACT|nr:DUF5106 domain-containing protein [Dysgonomonas alginatilytica]PXV66747.1 thioredoxin-like protein [Dysgonomonas alginatilytica]
MKKYNITYLSLLLLLGFCFLTCSSVSKKGESISEEKKDRKFIMATIPESLTTPSDRANYLVEHYWDNFDFADTAYIHLPSITEQAMADYIEILPHANKDIAYSSIKNTLLKAEADTSMNAYFLETYKKYLYDPNSPMRNEEYYIPVLNYVIESSKTNATDKERADFRLKMILKNRIGDKATDFTYTLASGKTGTLYDIRSEYTVVLFYNPDCHACAEVIAAIKNSPIISDGLESNYLSILSFYPDADLEIWKKHLNDIPTYWINGYDKNQTVQNKKIYDLKAIPTLYLLDKDKKIILKDVDFVVLEKWLSENKPIVMLR